MGLAQVQSALARLFTDAELRARFSADPNGTGHELGLSGEETAQLAEVARDGLATFAESLHRKRLSAVREHLPLTARALGPRFDVLFLEHAAQFRPTGIQKHLRDALAFAASLRQREDLLEPRWLRCLARYEATLADLRMSDRIFYVRFFRYHPRQMIARCEADSKAELSPKPCLAVWFRTWRRHGFRQWALPP